VVKRAATCIVFCDPRSMSVSKDATAGIGT
jgi:hypothetical protein